MTFVVGSRQREGHRHRVVVRIPKRWDEFQRRYRAELRQPEQKARLDELVTMARKAPVTLLYGARDEEHNQALALSRVLEDSLKK